MIKDYTDLCSDLLVFLACNIHTHLHTSPHTSTHLHTPLFKSPKLKSTQDPLADWLYLSDSTLNSTAINWFWSEISNAGVTEPVWLQIIINVSPFSLRESGLDVFFFYKQTVQDQLKLLFLALKRSINIKSSLVSKGKYSVFNTIEQQHKNCSYMLFSITAMDVRVKSSWVRFPPLISLTCWLSLPCHF